jgi:hypothetical protein
MTPLETLQFIRPTYPTPMSNNQLGEMLNRVAWIHRLEGYGLLSKPQGSNCRQPTTGKLIARDILTHVDDFIHYDCLVDAEGLAKPIWQDKGSYVATRFVSPVNSDIVIPPVPEPGPIVIPYNEPFSIEFGLACNEVYEQTTSPIDPGMISVQSQRAAYDYYVGGLPWSVSKQKHINELRAVYGLPPV